MADGPLFDDIPIDHISINFKKYVNFFRELTLLDEKITELGSIDHAIKEAKVRFERASALEVELQTRYDSIVDEALAKVKEAENEAKNILNKARNKEAEILASAGEKHTKTVKEAERAAETLIKHANSEAADIRNQIDEAKVALSKVVDEVESGRAKLVDLHKQVEAKHAEHKVITDKHEKFLASLGVR